jgi:hypothetical protein
MQQTKILSVRWLAPAPIGVANVFICSNRRDVKGVEALDWPVPEVSGRPSWPVSIRLEGHSNEPMFKNPTRPIDDAKSH